MAEVEITATRRREAASHGRLGTLTKWADGTAASRALPLRPLPHPPPDEQQRRPPVMIQVWTRA